MKKILVTGALGFIGSNFVYKCLESDPDVTVVVLDKHTYAGNVENLKAVDGSRVDIVKGDICDSALVASVLSSYKPIAVVNFAAETHVDRSIFEPDAFVVTNIVGTSVLLREGYRYWNAFSAPTRENFRFLHVSTDEVYGSLLPSESAFTEESRYKPNSPYSASKAASDHLVRAWLHTYKFPAITTNCSNNYGPYQFPEKLIPLMILSALAGKRLPIYGDGLQIRDWLYVEDHCNALLRVLESGRCGETYNIGGWNEKTNLEIVYTICELLDEMRPRADGISYKSQVTHVKDRPGHDRRYAIDARKIERELGWRPQETFETGIRKTVQWYLDNPGWVERVQNGSYREWINKQYSPAA